MNSPRLIKILGLVGLFLLVSLWFLFFFFPNTVEMSRVKRQVKDLGDQIQSNMRVDDEFEYSDQAELDRFSAAEAELRGSLPEVNGSDGFFRMIANISEFLKESAAAEGLSNLIVSSNSQDLEINAQTLPQAGQTLEELLQFTSNRLREIQVEEERQRGRTADTREIGSGEKGPFGLAHHTVFMTFAGELKPSLSFLHRLPTLDRSLRIERIVISEGVRQPLFLVHAKIYYWDTRQKIHSGEASEAGDAQE